MRVRNFFMYTIQGTQNGSTESIPTSALSLSDSSISDGDSVISLLTFSGSASSTDPYGNVNVCAKDGRVVLSGQITGVQFSKSSATEVTTDIADLIVIAAR